MFKLFSFFVLALCYSAGLSGMEKDSQTNGKQEQASLLACDFWELEPVRNAFAHNADPNIICPTDKKPLLIHIIDTSKYQHGDEKCLPEIVKEFVNQPTLKQETRDKALLIAAHRGFTKTVGVLINGGANVNVIAHNDSGLLDGRTPLHLSAQRGFLDIVQALVKSGADMYVKDSRGFEPVKLAKGETLAYLEDQQRMQQVALRKIRDLSRSLQKPVMTAAAFLLLVFILYLNMEKA